MIGLFALTNSAHLGVYILDSLKAIHNTQLHCGGEILTGVSNHYVWYKWCGVLEIMHITTKVPIALF